MDIIRILRMDGGRYLVMADGMETGRYAENASMDADIDRVEILYNADGNGAGDAGNAFIQIYPPET